MRLASGSTLGLLAHDLRLDWRRRTEVRGSRRWVALTLTLGAPLFLALVVGYPLGRLLNRLGPPQGEMASLVAVAALAGAFLFMLSQALAAVVDALFERGDLDLLFSSPVPPGRVITVRALGVAFTAFSVFGFFAAGPLLVIALMGHPGWLALLPLLYACALAATGVALALAAGLIRLIGAKRTRFTGRMLSVLFGSLIFIGTQIYAFAGVHPGSGSALPFLESVLGWLPAGLVLGAFAGQPLAFATVAVALLIPFVLATGLAGPGYAALHAAAQGAAFSAPTRAGRPRSFGRGPLEAVFVKETRLLLRDPSLLPQVLLRVVYLVPAGVLAVRYGAKLDFTAVSGAALALTLMASQLAGSLTWMTISAEDAPDLLASAPAARSFLLRVKLATAVGVVLAIVSLVAIPLAVFDLYQGAVVFGGCAAAATAAGLANLWWQRPGKRTAFRERASAPWFVSLAELILGLLIAMATGLFSAHQASGAGLLLLAVIVLGALRIPAKL